MSEKVYSDFGTVFFTEEVGEQTFERVRDAASAAAFPDGLVRELRPRNVFIRAIRRLAQEGLIEEGSEGVLRDKTVDDANVITFQFSKRYVEAAGAHYDKAAIVSFDKATQHTACDDPAILALAQSLYNKCSKVFLPQDINSMAKRVIEKAGARRLFLKDAIYFLPRQHFDLVEKLKKFYTHLDCDFYLLPVGSSANNAGELTRAVVKDVVREVQRLTHEVQKLRADDALTPRIAKARLEELRVALKQYQELAQSINVDLSSIIHDAGESGQVLQTVGTSSLENIIAAMQTGKKINPLVFDLMETAEPEACVNIQRSRIAPIGIDVEQDEQKEGAA